MGAITALGRSVLPRRSPAGETELQAPERSAATQTRPKADETAIIRRLQQIDAQTRAHEAAHLAAAGAYANGGPSFQYQTGPDGRLYAVGGEVPIDLSPGKTPEETIAKMKTIQRAATAPANPSAQDYAVGAQAAMIARQAYMEIAQRKAAASDSTHQIGENLDIKV